MVRTERAACSTELYNLALKAESIRELIICNINKQDRRATSYREQPVQQ